MQQLEFDWWGQLIKAQADPVGCDFRQLCLCFDAQMERSGAQEQLAVGAEAICLLANCLARRAEVTLVEWQQRYDRSGPVLAEEEWGELVRGSLWLDLEELMEETPERCRLPVVLKEGEESVVPVEKAELLEMLEESELGVLEQVGDSRRPAFGHRVDEDEDVGAWVRENGIKIKAPPPPQHIELEHWIERVEGSAIAPDVAEANVASIAGREVEQRLREERLADVGTGQLYTRVHRQVLDDIAQLAEGGAWNTGGIDATCLPTLTPGEIPTDKTWGEFKADNPRWDEQKQKIRNYEAPLGEKKGIFLPVVPDRIAWQVYHRHNITPKPEELESGFWFIAYHHREIDLTIVEG
jgi:hypothetical protein